MRAELLLRKNGNAEFRNLSPAEVAGYAALAMASPTAHSPNFAKAPSLDMDEVPAQAIVAPTSRWGSQFGSPSFNFRFSIPKRPQEK